MRDIFFLSIIILRSKIFLELASQTGELIDALGHDRSKFGAKFDFNETFVLEDLAILMADGVEWAENCITRVFFRHDLLNLIINY